MIILTVIAVNAMLINELSCHWLWKLVCEATNVTPEESYRYFRNLLRRKKRRLYLHLLSKAPDQDRFRKIYNIYRICSLPNGVCTVVAMMAAISDKDKTNVCAAVFTVVYNLVIWLIGVAYGKKQK